MKWKDQYILKKIKKEAMEFSKEIPMREVVTSTQIYLNKNRFLVFRYDPPFKLPYIIGYILVNDHYYLDILVSELDKGISVKVTLER